MKNMLRKTLEFGCMYKKQHIFFQCDFFILYLKKIKKNWIGLGPPKWVGPAKVGQICWTWARPDPTNRAGLRAGPAQEWIQKKRKLCWCTVTCYVNSNRVVGWRWREAYLLLRLVEEVEVVLHVVAGRSSRRGCWAVLPPPLLSLCCWRYKRQIELVLGASSVGRSHRCRERSR